MKRIKDISELKQALYVYLYYPTILDLDGEAKETKKSKSQLVQEILDKHYAERKAKLKECTA